MNIGAWLGWCAAVAIAVLIAMLIQRRRRGAAREDAELASRPPGLRTATLAYMEAQFRIRAPIPLVARVDRAYRGEDGKLVLVELKTRRNDRVYATDVIQLSAQRLALEGQTRQRVAATGFVTVQLPEGSGAARSRRVELLDATEVVALHRRREDIISGRIAPRYADSRSACEGCAFRARCDGPHA